MKPLSANATGAAWMAASMAGYVISDAALKLVFQRIDLFQVIALRNSLVVLAFAIMCWRSRAFFVPGGTLVALCKRAVLLRVAAETLAAFFFLTALQYMPLANATAVMQLPPLTITLVAALYLRESVGWRRWLAIFAGFMGVLLVLQPGPEGFSIWSLYALAAVAAVTVRDIATRSIDANMPTPLISLMTASSILVFGLIGSIFTPWTNPEGGDITLIVIGAIFTTVAYLSSVAAMRQGDVSFVSPFRYTGLIWALILGLILFGDVPNWLELLGTFIIVASGAYTFFRERKKSKPIAVVERPSLRG